MGPFLPIFLISTKTCLVPAEAGPSGSKDEVNMAVGNPLNSYHQNPPLRVLASSSLLQHDTNFRYLHTPTRIGMMSGGDYKPKGRLPLLVKKRGNSSKPKHGGDTMARVT